ncbi:carboxypeptidase-like regulatory domain-containing protein [Pontibacter sp. CAU 1760]
MHRHLLLGLFAISLLCIGLPAHAQRTLRLSGTVLQPDKQTPIPGATIVKISTKAGVLSDAQGKFRIDLEPQDTLLVRAVGFKPLMYLPSKLPVSELRVNIVLQEDSIMLGEVEVTSRPSQEMIDRALRNMKREQASQVKRPGYIPGLEPPPPPPAAGPTVANPIGLMYDMFSKEGKERRKVEELKRQEELKEKLKEEDDYNRFFKDNRGYE